MIRSWILSSRLATTRSMKSMAFGTARSMPESQQDSYQGSTIWSCRKATLRRRIPGSLHRRSNTFKGSSPPTTKTIQRNRQRHLLPSIRPHQWLSHPLHSGQQPRNKADLLDPRRSRQRNVADQLGPPPPPSERRSPRLFSYSIFFQFSSLASY